MKTINLIKAATMMVVMLFAGMAFQSCQETKPLTQAELEGYWVLKTINGQEAKTKFSGAQPTLQFNFDESTISGTGGCNQYNGAYTYKDGILAAPNLAVTQMLCTEPNEEGQYLLELSNMNNKLSIDNGLLTITHDGKIVLQFEKGEAPVANTTITPDANTLGGVWKLKNIDGADATSRFKGDNATIPTLSFNFTDNKISGNGGCNRYNAPFTLNNGQLIVSPIMSTKMACPNLEGEAQFAQAIADTSLITLPNENILQLAKNGVVLLEFEKQAADQAQVAN